VLDVVDDEKTKDFPRPWLSLYTSFFLSKSFGDAIQMFRIDPNGRRSFNPSREIGVVKFPL
jgi:hypothetical protein